MFDFVCLSRTRPPYRSRGNRECRTNGSLEGRSERAVHDEEIGLAVFRMTEPGGDSADNLETQAFPEPCGTLICRDDCVVLHRPVAELPRGLDGVLSERATDVPATSGLGHHV